MARRPAVLLLHNLPPETAGDLDELARRIRDRVDGIDLERATDYDDAIDRIETAEVVIEHRAEELFEHAEELEWVQSLSAGYDRYDVDRLDERGVILTTVSGVHANPIAEHVLGYMLLFEREFRRTIDQQARGEWRRFAPGELMGKTLAVVGVGAIGSRIAERAGALDMHTLGVKRDLSTVPEGVDEVFAPEDLHTVLGRADYAVLACPLTDATRGMIGPEELSSLGQDGVLVNIARGPVVDQGALLDALRAGNIRGAALDVATGEPLDPDSPLWTMSNVVITPHMAGGSPRYPRRCAAIFAENYRAFVGGDRDDMRNRVV